MIYAVKYQLIFFGFLINGVFGINFRNETTEVSTAKTEPYVQTWMIVVLVLTIFVFIILLVGGIILWKKKLLFFAPNLSGTSNTKSNDNVDESILLTKTSDSTKLYPDMNGQLTSPYEMQEIPLKDPTTKQLYNDINGHATSPYEIQPIT